MTVSESPVGAEPLDINEIEIRRHLAEDRYGKPIRGDLEWCLATIDSLRSQLVEAQRTIEVHQACIRGVLAERDSFDREAQELRGLVERYEAFTELVRTECDRSNEQWRNGDFDTVKIYVDREMCDALAALSTPTEGDQETEEIRYNGIPGEDPLS